MISSIKEKMMLEQKEEELEKLRIELLEERKNMKKMKKN